MLVLSLATVAFAEGQVEQPKKGSITINGASNETVYKIYRLLDLESFDKEASAYSYKVNAFWAGFFATEDALKYVAIDKDGYVTWIGGEDDSIAAEFAKLALAYAKENEIEPVKSSENEGEFVITGNAGKFSDLDLGWYLVDSNAGALCGLTTTDLDASVNAKNHAPTIDKQVQEDLTGMWGDKNTADIGQIVNFMTIIHAAAGAENYVLHDAMSDGLTFEHNIDEGRGVTEIKHINSAGVETTLKNGTDYTVKTTDFCDNGCDFEIVFSENFVASLKPNDRILAYYNAMLNRHAVIAGEGNANETWLEYGEDHTTTHDLTHTFTFSIDIVKTDSTNKLIDGAEFKIYDAITGGNEVGVVQLMESDDKTPKLDEDGNIMYRRAREDEMEAGLSVPIMVKGGKVTVVGFDNGTYYLEETKAPEGYNKLTARKEFTIADGNLDAVFNGPVYSSGSGVHVVNKTGSMLPETGAMGTALFITFGMIVVIGTGLLLVTKKRMSMIQE